MFPLASNVVVAASVCIVYARLHFKPIFTILSLTSWNEYMTNIASIYLEFCAVVAAG